MGRLPYAEEGGFRQMVYELRRLWRRAHSRPLIVLAIAGLATAGAVLRQSMEKDRFTATVTYRVMERVPRTEGAHPMTKRRLREYVADGIFTRKHCREIVDRYGLFPGYSFDPNFAVDKFRWEIQIKVFKNYFLDYNLDDEAARSARIRISFTYTDVNTAATVVRDLGQLIEDHENEIRKAMAQFTAQQAQIAIERSEDRMDRLRARTAEAQLELLRATGPRAAELNVELDQLRSKATSLEIQEEQVLSEQGRTELMAGLEKNQLLLGFALIDSTQTPAPRLSKKARLALVGVIVFLFFLPISAIAVAAFDPRIYHIDDVRRLGLKPLGHVPSFTGDTVGTLPTREAMPAHHPAPPVLET